MEFKKERAVVQASFFQQLRTHFTAPVGTYAFFDYVLNECQPNVKVYLSCENGDDEGESIDLSLSSDSDASYDSEDSEEEEAYYRTCVDEMRRMKKGNYFVVDDRRENKKQKRI